jgi:hypothetical protein
LFNPVDHSIDVKIKKSQLEKFLLSIKANLERHLKKKWNVFYTWCIKYNKHMPFNSAHLPHAINAHDPITYVGGAWGFKPHA